MTARHFIDLSFGLFLAFSAMPPLWLIFFPPTRFRTIPAILRTILAFVVAAAVSASFGRLVFLPAFLHIYVRDDGMIWESLKINILVNPLNASLLLAGFFSIAGFIAFVLFCVFFDAIPIRPSSPGDTNRSKRR